MKESENSYSFTVSLSTLSHPKLWWVLPILHLFPFVTFVWVSLSLYSTPPSHSHSFAPLLLFPYLSLLYIFLNKYLKMKFYIQWKLNYFTQLKKLKCKKFKLLFKEIENENNSVKEIKFPCILNSLNFKCSIRTLPKWISRFWSNYKLFCLMN